MKIDSFLDVLKPQLEKLAKDTVKDAATEAVETGLGFVRSMQADIADWLEELKSGDLSLEDFEDLLLGEKDLMKITLLTEKGLSAARIEKFRNAVVELPPGMKSV